MNDSFGLDTMQIFHTSGTLQSPAHYMGCCVNRLRPRSVCPMKYCDKVGNNNYLASTANGMLNGQ